MKPKSVHKLIVIPAIPQTIYTQFKIEIIKEFKGVFIFTN